MPATQSQRALQYRATVSARRRCSCSRAWSPCLCGPSRQATAKTASFIAIAKRTRRVRARSQRRQRYLVSPCERAGDICRTDAPALPGDVFDGLRQGFVAFEGLDSRPRRQPIGPQPYPTSGRLARALPALVRRYLGAGRASLTNMRSWRPPHCVRFLLTVIDVASRQENHDRAARMASSRATNEERTNKLQCALQVRRSFKLREQFARGFVAFRANSSRYSSQNRFYSGMLSCFFLGFSKAFSRSRASERAIRFRVSRGAITAST